MDESSNLQNIIKVKKELNLIKSKSKLESCFYCCKKVSSFCKSHSTPAFLLKNISDNGDVLTANLFFNSPIDDEIQGVKKAGIFNIICDVCDNKLFRDYENPNNYDEKPSNKILTQIELKNVLKIISKRIFEIQLHNTEHLKNEFNLHHMDYRSLVSNIDLKEYESIFRNIKSKIEKGKDIDYYLACYIKLDYVVPIAFNGFCTLITDFDGNVINNTFDNNVNYKIKHINICVFPLKNKSIIMLFVDKNNERYKSIFKKLNKMNLTEKLNFINFIIFKFCEDYFLNSSLLNIREVLNPLSKLSISQPMIPAFYEKKDIIDYLRGYTNYSEMDCIPNILLEQYCVKGDFNDD